LVICDSVGFDLGWRQPDGDVDRDLFQAELDGRLVAGVTNDDDAQFVHHDRLAKPERSD
jgi:hypothetical protein